MHKHDACVLVCTLPISFPNACGFSWKFTRSLVAHVKIVTKRQTYGCFHWIGFMCFECCRYGPRLSLVIVISSCIGRFETEGWFWRYQYLRNTSQIVNAGSGLMYMFLYVSVHNSLDYVNRTCSLWRISELSTPSRPNVKSKSTSKAPRRG